MNVNESDLQKAIDDIAKASGGGASPADGATASPYIPTDGQVPVNNTTTAAPQPEAATTPPVVDTPPPAPVTPPSVPETPAPAEGGEGDEAQPESEEEAMDADSVREKAIDDLKPMIGTVDLKPLLGKVDLLPETKFKIYKSMIETTRDKDALPMAYATAKDITSDEARAEALLYLVEMVDKL